MAILNNLDDVLRVAKKTADDIIGNKTATKALYSSGVDDAAKAAQKIVGNKSTTKALYSSGVEESSKAAQKITKYNTTAPRYDVEAAKETAKKIAKTDTTTQYVGSAGEASNQIVKYNTTSQVITDNRELAKQTAKKYQNASQEPKRIGIENARQTANEVVSYNSTGNVPVNNPRYTYRNVIDLDESQYRIIDDNTTYRANSGKFETSPSGGGGGGNGSGGGGGNRTGTGGPNNNNTGGGGGGPKGNRQSGGGNAEGSGFNAKGFAGQAYDFFTGGIRDSYNNVRSGQNLFEAIDQAHRKADGSFDMWRAAGTFMTASAAARIASGGGLYKDRYGNPNIIGIPFI